MSWTHTTHPDADTLAEAVAGILADAIREGIAQRGQAVVALAGGRTPLPAYRRLAAVPLEWNRVTLLATDERWVESDHPACNTRELRAEFAAAGGARVLPLAPSGAGKPASAAFARAKLASLPGPFDAVLLGMGADGHFASLFPGAAELQYGLDPKSLADALVVHPDPPPPEAPFPRISLSRSRLVRTRRLLLAVTGAAKRAILDEAMMRPAPASLPISALLHDDSAKVEIHWSP